MGSWLLRGLEPTSLALTTYGKLFQPQGRAEESGFP